MGKREDEGGIGERDVEERRGRGNRIQGCGKEKRKGGIGSRNMTEGWGREKTKGK